MNGPSVSAHFDDYDLSGSSGGGWAAASEFAFLADESASAPHSDRQTQATSGQTPGPIANIVPRQLKLSLALAGSYNSDPLAALAAAGLLQVREIVLTYDVAGSVGERPVWRSERCAKTGCDWTLTALPMETRARLSLRKITERNVLTPLAWTSDVWDASTNNLLKAEGRNPLLEALPAVSIVPA